MLLKPKNIILFTATVFVSSFLFAGCSQKTEEINIDLNKINKNLEPTQAIISPTTMPIEATNSPSTKRVASESGQTLVSLKTKDGDIVIKLYDQVAPNTVANFLSKIKSKFYDGLTFHRVIPGFMAQGGDPEGTGMGGGTIASEINDLPFKKGTLGLARGGNKAISNDSQFFMCYDDTGCAHLNGDYVNFGEVISGFDVLNKIVQGDKIIEFTDQIK